MKLKEIRKNGLLWCLLATFFIGGAILQLKYTKLDIFLFINGNHCTVADFIFSYYTNLGDGAFFALFIVLIFFISRRRAFIGLVSFLLSSLIAQVLKHVFFPNTFRPLFYFWDQFGRESMKRVHTVPGVHVSIINSFPSGHSATAFAIFTLIALYFCTNNKRHWLTVLSFILAVSVGYSRIYLAQHFFLDVYFGAMIGAFSSLLAYYFINVKRYLVVKRFFNKVFLKRIIDKARWYCLYKRVL